MAIKLGKYKFTGPIKSLDKIKNRPGLFAIICRVENEYFLTDVGESSRLRTRIENNENKECWKDNCKGKLTIYVHYTMFVNQEKRLTMEHELRELFQPDCEACINPLFTKGLPFF